MFWLLRFAGQWHYNKEKHNALRKRPMQEQAKAENRTAAILCAAMAAPQHGALFGFVQRLRWGIHDNPLPGALLLSAVWAVWRGRGAGKPAQLQHAGRRFLHVRRAAAACRFYCRVNVYGEQARLAQEELMRAGAVDFVAALQPGLERRFPAYVMADACTYDSGEGLRTWYLYKRAE